MTTADPDAGILALRQILQDFEDFCVSRGGASEADTRVKVIDRVLTDVLGWPESAIDREGHVESGFIDYTLTVQNRPFVAVEAKKEGVAFVLPVDPNRKSLKLSGTLLTDGATRDAVHQVRRYCDDGGIRYAIATNGYAWVVFRAIREDMSWRDGYARVFSSLQHAVEHFTDFWNLLSYHAIASGSLDEEFGSARRVTRRLLRVSDRLFNADLPLQRNRLHSQLDPLIQTVFEDIATQDPLEILQSCYVHTQSLQIAARDLDTVIVDAMPRFLKDDGAVDVHQRKNNAGEFGLAVARVLPTLTGQLFLLLGGIGAGKTTFIKRYQRTVGRPVLDHRALWFHIDFLAAPLDPKDMEPFVWKSVLKQLRERYASPYLETRQDIKRAFVDEIAVLNETALRHLRQHTDEYEAALSPYLERWQSDVVDYVPKLLTLAKSRRGLHLVLFIDNVDQLPPSYQSQIFLLSQRATRTVGSITILALREESYYAAKMQRTLTAYTSRKFHIASPRFRRMIDSRIRFALSVLEKSSGPVDYVLPNGVAVDRKAIADFLRIVNTSIFEVNRNIARFIEFLCFGNMRMALNMFSLFMTSGATDVDKMLAIYRREGDYFVASHEFVKSVMLGDRCYYKEAASDIMNVFDCGAEKNASHFTALRIIHLLSERKGDQNREGQGYVDIGAVVSTCEDVFDNREDVIRSLNRLVRRQLVEANTKSQDSIDGASHVRATSAGWYYTRFLVNSFCYLDLVLQDTPLNDGDVEAQLRRSVTNVDNLGDREDEKVARLAVRFERVRTFLRYLAEEEDDEWRRLGSKVEGVLARRFAPQLIAEIQSEMAWIDRRVRENRERVREDVFKRADDEPTTEDTDENEPLQMDLPTAPPATEQT
jgi:hypothetical protein